jgi:transposase
MPIFKTQNQFMSRGVYESCIDRNHFLVKLGEVFDWYALSEPLVSLALNSTGGRPRWAPEVMVKMLFLSFLFDLSDRDTEALATNHLAAKYFLGLPINEKAPDFSTLARFRDEVLMKKGIAYFLTLFRELTAKAKAHGVVFGTVHAIDSTHVSADVDTAKDGHDQKHYGSKPRDSEAAYGVKGSEEKMGTNGKLVSVLKTFYGFKAHLLAETNFGLVTGVHATPGNIADIDGGDDLIHKQLTEEEQKSVAILTADKGYACPVWINLLEKHTGIITAFSLPKTMTARGEHARKWKGYEADESRKVFRHERPVIERVNADLKDNHGLRRCRFLGLSKFTMQTIMASVAHNAKIIVRLLSGVRLRPI